MYVFIPNQQDATIPLATAGKCTPKSPNGALRYVAKDNPCSTPISPVILPTIAIIILATNVAVATPQIFIPSIPLAPKLNTEITIAIPIQIFANPNPPSVRFFEVIGNISSEISVLFLFSFTFVLINIASYLQFFFSIHLSFYKYNIIKRG